MGSKGFDMEMFFAALADRTRLRLLNLMAMDEICVCFFVETLAESQPKVSRHLAYLRRARLVEVRRDGKWSHYRLAEPSDEKAARVFRVVLAWLAEDPAMQRDRRSLAKVCCAPQLPVQLQGGNCARLDDGFCGEQHGGTREARILVQVESPAG